MSVNKTISPCRQNKREAPSDVQFSSQQETDKCLNKYYRGDLYAIGRIWIQCLRAILVGATFCPIPSIHAGQVKKDPERPPPIKASELPAYFSPHEAYKSFLEDKYNCESHLLHDMILPYVKNVRQNCQDAITAVKTEVCDTYNELSSDFAMTKKNVTSYWRADDHLVGRKALVAGGGLVGYHIGSQGGTIRRVICSAYGIAATGMLCFPKYTDEVIRNVCYHTGKALASGLTYMTDRKHEIREHLPCPKPKPPDEKFVNNMCSEKKK